MTPDGDYLTVRQHADECGLAVIDRIERQRYTLQTSKAVTPDPIDTDQFQFPVGHAVSFTTQTLRIPDVVTVYAHDESGSVVAGVEHLDEETLEAGQYTLELATQVKTYLRVTGPVEISAGIFETQIEFSEPTAIELGARSSHRRPAATVTTTASPRDMMAAVETFGSALQTTTPERSYPTLRGHPPAVELGSELTIPDSINQPTTGITLEVPPDLEAVYTVGPLAYYLGASIEPAANARLVTDRGFEYDLDDETGLEQTVEQVLKHVFTLDCVVRTEGLYQLPLHERQAIEADVSLDFADLYNMPLSQQVATYLEIPHDVVKEQVPQWQVEARVAPRPQGIVQLPYLIDDLAVVYPTTGQSRAKSTTSSTEHNLTRTSAFVRSSDPQSRTETSFVDTPSTDALAQAWVGDGVPIGASTPTPVAFQNRFEQEQTDGDLSITVVINDSRMEAERELVDEVYGNRDNLPFDVAIHQDLSKRELRECLQTHADFFHFIGHTDERGLECRDGFLDAAALEATSAVAFLLNSCNSYEQGLSLVDAGAVGGIVTLNDVINDEAVRIGELLARFLNSGFPLRAALAIASEQSPLGGQYTVVGDGSVTVTQPASRTPLLIELSNNKQDYSAKYNGYAASDAGLGSVMIPHIRHNDMYYLSTGSIPTFQITQDELINILQMEEMPVQTDDGLVWSSQLLERLQQNS